MNFLKYFQLASTNIFNNIDKCENPVTLPNGSMSCTPPGKDQILTLVMNITNIALGLIATISLIFLIMGGVSYMTSGGNPDNVSKAKNTIFYAIVGLVLSIVAWSIVSFINGAF